MKKLQIIAGLVMAFILPKAYAQNDIYNLYSCSPVQMPPPFVNLPPELLYENLLICGLTLEDAQQVVNDTFDGLIGNGWEVDGQCSMTKPSFFLCKSSGRF